MSGVCGALWLLLASGVGGPAAGADEAAGDAERVAAEFRLRGENARAALGAMEAVRLAFPGDPDPAAAIARWESSRREFDAAFRRQGELRADYNRLLHRSVFVSMASDLINAKAGQEVKEGGRQTASDSVGVSDWMRSQLVRENGLYQDEAAAFTPLADAHRRRAAETRRLLLAAGSAAALLLGACVLYAFAGPRPRAAAPPRAAHGPRPTVAGNFEVLSVLGRGSMGEVYEALDTTLNRRVALKRLRPELLQDPKELERLLGEARVMASLKHPNMVAIHGVERDAGQVYLALELVDGGTLDARLARERRLTWPESLRVLAGAGAAVDYCHGHGVIHRDLKPANIMLSVAGEVKVTDFSISYAAGRAVSRLTRQPSWGTPPYMAPEQELGELSGAVDIYALGVCFYEMVTGELPFPGPNFLAQKRESAWAPPRKLVPELPPGTDELIAVALAPEPARRFSSAAALVAACRSLGA